MPANADTLTDEEARAVVESLYGPLPWGATAARIQCPFIHSHTGPNNETDCKIEAQPFMTEGGVKPPGMYCFHASCRGLCREESRKIQSALGKQATKKNPLPRAMMAARPKPAPPPPKPKHCPAALEKFASKLGPVSPDWFAERSRKRVDNRRPASFLHDLFLPAERVLLFDLYASQGQELWEHPYFPYNATALDHFCGGGPKGRCCGIWFLSNPISGEWFPRPSLKNPDKKTRRDERCVTAFRYMMVESDEANSGHWLSAVAQLPLPISSLVTSGGDSVHALIRMDAESKADWDAKKERLKPALVTLGADAGAMSAVRLTRLPCCLRHGKEAPDEQDKKINHYVPYAEPRLQRLLFMNPDPDGTPICELSKI